jgi:hypothetical protein
MVVALYGDRATLEIARRVDGGTIASCVAVKGKSCLQDGGLADSDDDDAEVESR